MASASVSSVLVRVMEKWLNDSKLYDGPLPDAPPRAFLGALIHLKEESCLTTLQQNTRISNEVVWRGILKAMGDVYERVTFSFTALTNSDEETRAGEKAKLALAIVFFAETGNLAPAFFADVTEKWVGVPASTLRGATMILEFAQQRGWVDDEAFRFAFKSDSLLDKLIRPAVSETQQLLETQELREEVRVCKALYNCAQTHAEKASQQRDRWIAKFDECLQAFNNVINPFRHLLDRNQDLLEMNRDLLKESLELHKVNQDLLKSNQDCISMLWGLGSALRVVMSRLEETESRLEEVESCCEEAESTIASITTEVTGLRKKLEDVEEILRTEQDRCIDQEQDIAFWFQVDLESQLQNLKDVHRAQESLLQDTVADVRGQLETMTTSRDEYKRTVEELRNELQVLKNAALTEEGQLQPTRTVQAPNRGHALNAVNRPLQPNATATKEKSSHRERAQFSSDIAAKENFVHF